MRTHLRPQHATALLLLGLLAPAGAQPQWVVPQNPLVRGRQGHAMAYDPVRNRTVLFGGFTASTYFSDTWEYDGVSWTRRTPATTPPARADHALAYDGIRGRVLLFGGRDPAVNFGDTWEWDGTDWRALTPAASPPARHSHAMVSDRIRGRLVLFGGVVTFNPLSDTWEWDGATWLPLAPPASPPARSLHAMAWDARRGRTVLFGGTGPSCPFPCVPYLSDTWEWDGTVWAQATPAARPASRAGHAMAFDDRANQVVVFGGFRSSEISTIFADTWEWNGTNWTQRTPPVSPQKRIRSAMVHDGARGRAVLFGGTDASPLSDTWEWDGTAWTLAVPGTAPQAQALPGLAYDRARGRTVYVGSVDSTAPRTETWEWDGTIWQRRLPAQSPPASEAVAYDSRRGRLVLFAMPMSQTWEWDGTNWLQRSPAASPSARTQCRLAYDEARGRTVLFGGDFQNAALCDTWEWDGTNWTQRQPANPPPERRWPRLAYDAARARVVLFGGANYRGPNPYLSDTWEWDGTDWTQRASGPLSGRIEHALAYDAARARTVVFGGYNGMAWLNDVWEWDGTSWLQRSPSGNPPTMLDHAMAWDAGRGRMVLAGGRLFNGGLNLDVYEYFSPCDTVGAGHPGGGNPITCLSPPRIGSSFCVSFSYPPPAGVAYHLLLVAPAPGQHPAIPLGPPQACAPGLLHVAPQLVIPISGEPAVFCLQLPAHPAAIGVSAWFQGGSLDRAFCFRLTDALAATVQP
jgi:hypothetical protein